MASLRQIRRRMKSIENIHEITKAMEMIAAFRFKKAETRFMKARPYFLETEKLIADLSGAAGEVSHALFEKRAVKKKTLLVLAADKGLCGAYNTNLLRAALAWLAENRDFETSLVPAGKVGVDFFRKKNLPVLSAYPEKTAVTSEFAKKITADLAFPSGSISKSCVWGERRSSMRSWPRTSG
ncbi:MAG: F0F1 ATP synthase subunit gamma [Candidatus Omnitrophica bacterium]|nr:F0F1 ATP synthase subunit gamma [Candidatus Omnitrophota bacterium]